MGAPLRSIRTFVFTDIEGSTRLQHQIGHAFGALLERHDELLSATVLDFGGEMVNSTGDGIFAVFASPPDAAAAVREIQQRVREERWCAGVRLRVRIGMHAGPATLAGGSPAGVAVHLAARICNAAHGGQVLLSEAVAGELPSSATRPLGPHLLKDFDEPVELWQLSGPGLEDEHPSPRAPPHTEATAELLERRDELRTLAAAVSALADERRGGVVLIEGPAGVGKTALLRAALTLPQGRRLTALRARGSQLEGELAFGGVRQLFAGHMLAMDEGRREGLLAGPAGLSSPVLGLAPPVRDGRTLGDPLFGLYWLTIGLSEEAPLLLAVDDLQWLDDESRRFVAYLAERLDGVAVMLLATVRTEADLACGSLAPVARDAVIIRPRPLSEEACVRFVGARDAGEAHRVSGGNPLFLAEIRRGLVSAPQASLAELVPRSVARLVLDRIGRLSPAATSLARAVALFADGAEFDDVARVADLNEDLAAAAADELIAAEVLADGEPLRFLHPLMRQAVYDDMGTFSRRRGHQRGAAVLKDRLARAEAIAAQLLAGASCADTDDVRILIEAADEAEQRRALAAAVRYIELALRGPLDQVPRAKLRGRLGHFQAVLGRPEAVETLERAVGETKDRVEQLDLAIVLGKVSAAHDPRATLPTLIEVQRTGEADPQRSLAIDSLIVTSAWSSRDIGTARAALARLPRDLPGETAHERHALSVLAFTEYAAGAPAAVVRDLTLRSLGDSGETELEVGGDATDSSVLLVMTGDLAAAEAYAQERLHRARELGSSTAIGDVQIMLSEAALTRGRVREAEGASALALEVASGGRTRSFLATQIARAQLARGRFSEAEATVTSTKTFEFPHVIMALAALGRGDLSAALGSFARTADWHARTGMTAPASNAWITRYADALAAASRRAEALEMLEQYLASAQHFDETRVLGVAHHALGSHLDGSAALSHLEDAHALLDPSPYRRDAAELAVTLGTVLIANGRSRAARELMLPALEYAQDEAIDPLIHSLRKQLVRAGAQLERFELPPTRALAPADERLARMAALDLSEHEIAQQLLLPVGEVERRLAEAARTLGVSDRRELVELVRREAQPTLDLWAARS